MSNPQPAIPAQAATPGSGGQSQPSSPVVPSTPITTGQGEKSGEATVTVSASEYRALERDRARLQSFQRRSAFTPPSKSSPTKTTTGDIGYDGDLPDDVIELIRKNQEAKEAAETRAFRAELSVEVNALLAKPEFATLPESTKKLIIKSPWTLSDAKSVEEAALDIEDYLRDNAVVPTGSAQQPAGGTPASRAAEPPGRETPSVSGGGTAAPVDTQALEDISTLIGVARSRAVLRNAMKKAMGKATQV